MKDNDTTYLGNPLLKGKGQKIEWTSELLEEYLRCKDDIIYFCETYMRIVNVDHGIVPFKLYDYQKELILSMSENRKTIANCSRQSGKTVSFCGFVLHYLLFNSQKTVGILANKADTSREILDRVKKSYELLPKWLQQGVVEWNKTSISLDNGSKAIAAATSSSSIRGKSLNVIVLDECAFIENFNEFYTSTFPTISSGKTTKIIMISTTYGLNHFFRFWQEAIEDRNGFNPIEVKWDRVPGRDEKWKIDTLKGLNHDIEKFEQEFNCSFLGSSGTLISGSTLKSLKPMEPINTSETLDSLTQYFKPVPNRKYTIMVDVAEGIGLDYSAFQVIDITEMPYQQVCTYKNNLIEIKDYAGIVHNISKMYNDASILVEINNMGATVSHILYNEYENENMIFTENAGKAGQRISTGFGKLVHKGIKTSSTTKRIGCSVLKMLVEQKQLVINDHATIEELSRFSRDGDSYEAEEGANDDLVMGLVLFAWMTNQKYFTQLTDINTMANLRKQTDDQIITSLLPFMIVDSSFHNNSDHQTVIDYNNPETFFESTSYYNF